MNVHLASSSHLHSISLYSLIIALSACSWLTQEAHEEQRQGSTNTSPPPPSAPTPLATSAPKINKRLIIKGLGACSDNPAARDQESIIEHEEPDTDSDSVWQQSQSPLQLCRFPTVTFRCQQTFSGKRQGAQVIEAIVNKSNGHVLWRGVIASEEIPSAHGERVYSQTQLKPIVIERDQSSPCYAFTATRVQRARSFNLVDAREEEFDEASEDELIFDYSAQLNQYVERDEVNEPAIKVRAR